MKRPRKSAASFRTPAVPAAAESGFPQRLRAAREERRLSQTELERITGIAQAVIANYEAGRYRPGFREILRLCYALRLTPNRLLTGLEDPFSQQDVAASFGPIDLSSPDLAQQLRGIVHSSMVLAVQEPDDRRALFALMQSLIRKRLKPDELRQLEGVSEVIAKVFEAASPQIQHDLENVIEDPSLKPYFAKRRTPRRSK